jgi:hypothetical protein
MTNGQKCDVYQVCELIKSCFKRVCVCVCVCERERENERGREAPGLMCVKPLSHITDLFTRCTINCALNKQPIKYSSNDLCEWFYVSNVHILVCLPYLCQISCVYILTNDCTWPGYVKTYRMDKVCPHTHHWPPFYIQTSGGNATRLLDLVKNAVNTTVFSNMYRESMGMKKWPVFLQVRGFHKLANIRGLQMLDKYAHLLEHCFNPDERCLSGKVCFSNTTWAVVYARTC